MAQNMVLIKCFLNEISEEKFAEEYLLFTSDNPYVVKILGITDIEDKKGIVMEYYEMNLATMITELYLNEKIIIMMQIATCFNDCQKKNIIHGRFNLNNVYLKLSSDKTYVPIISGFSYSTKSDVTVSSFPNLVKYASPEMVNDQQTINGFMSDIWSFGVVFIQLITGITPFENMSNENIIEKLLKNGIPFEDELLDEIPGFTLIKQCFLIEPSERPTFSMLIDFLDVLIGRCAVLGFDEKIFLKRTTLLQQKKNFITYKEQQLERNIKDLSNRIKILEQKNKKLLFEKEKFQIFIDKLKLKHDIEQIEWKKKNKDLQMKVDELTDQLSDMSTRLNSFDNNITTFDSIINEDEIYISDDDDKGGLWNELHDHDTSSVSSIETPKARFEETPVFIKELDNKYVYAMDYSNDGKYFVIAGDEKTFCVYDAETHIKLIKKENITAVGLNFSPNSKFLAISSSFAVTIFETKTWTPVHLFENFSHDINHVWFGADNNLLSIGMDNGFVAIFSIDGQIYKEFKPHIDRVKSVRISPDLRYFATVSNDGFSKLFSLKTFEEIYVWDHGKSFVVSGNFSPNSKYWVTGDNVFDIRVFDVDSKFLLRKYKIHSSCVYSLFFSQDSSLIYSCANDKSFTIIERETGQVLQKVHTPCHLWTMALNYDCNRLLCAGYEPSVVYEYVSEEIFDEVSQKIVHKDSCHMM
eukprot:TRINITY_DN834_c0_g1_i1.p1 TRINITY_DN834_c0_g1~~TRINITY_DN834_c0_g1_i1.p1  ORF type:complete len:717 (+),score=196.29 TRINITY_DN834_c0_g1_i1:66-2153(+)